MSPRVVDPTERSRAVITAAAAVFARHGYTAATIAEIARQAGIGKGTTYEYFDSKPALFLAAFRQEWQAVVEAVERAALSSDRSTARRLEALSGAVLEGHQRMQPLKPAMIEFMRTGQPGQHCHGIRAAHRDGVQRFQSLATRILRDGESRGEIRAGLDNDALATALIGTLEGLAFQAGCDPTLDPSSVWEPYLEIILAGLGSVSIDPAPSPRRVGTLPTRPGQAVEEPARASRRRPGGRAQPLQQKS